MEPLKKWSILQNPLQGAKEAQELLKFTRQVRMIKMEMIKGERCWQAIQEDSPSLSPLYVNMANIPRENTRVPWEM